MQGRASWEDVAPQSCCYRSKTVESEGSMGWRIFTVEQPCVVPPLIRSLPSHILPQTFQNFDVECSINCLTKRNKFFVNNSLLIKETNQH